MKKLKTTAVWVFALLISMNIYAQNEKKDTKKGYGETIFKNTDEFSYGYYGSLMPGYSFLNDNHAFVASGKVVFIVNHKFGVGLQVSNIISKTVELTETTDDAIYEGHSIGLVLEPIFYSNKAFSISTPLTIGGGTLSLNYKDYDNRGFWDNDDFNEDNNIDYVNYFKITPGIELDLHIIKWCKVGIGAYYTYRNDMGKDNTLDIGLMSDFSFGLNLKFGKF